MKKLIFYIILMIFSLNIVFASISNEEIIQAKSIIDSKIPCNQLTLDQLKILGEYFMEQMHPGDAHELMDEMMGLEENPAQDELFHQNLAKTIYCDESNRMVGYQNMQRMMSNKNFNTGTPMMIGTSYWNVSNTLYIIFLFLLIILVLFVIFKLYQNVSVGKKKRQN